MFLAYDVCVAGRSGQSDHSEFVQSGRRLGHGAHALLSVGALVVSQRERRVLPEWRRNQRFLRQPVRDDCCGLGGVSGQRDC